MNQRRFIVTSGLPYSNGRLHVGHVAGAYLPADTWVRYLRARGDEALFVCGSDDNGVAALIAHPAGQSGDRLDVVGEHVGTTLEDRGDLAEVPLEVADQ